MELGFPLPLPLKASLYNGMLSDDITPVTASCLSGNCTWPVTPSLAVCGACSASTYHLACDDTFCNYTMPSGSVISLINPEKVSGGTGFAVVPGNGSKWDFNLHDKLYIANFDAVGASDRSLVQGFNASTAKASECAMWSPPALLIKSKRSYTHFRTLIRHRSPHLYSITTHFQHFQQR
jgi:hypothetical protein